MSNYNYRYWTDGNSDGAQGGYNVRTNTNYEAALEAMSHNGGSGLQRFDGGVWSDYSGGPSLAEQASPVGGSSTEFHGLSNSPYLTATNDGYTRISGGTNMLGMQRPESIIMRNQNGNLDDRFKETMGDSFKRLGQIGNEYGNDVDSRETIQFGSAMNKLQERALSEGDSEWAVRQKQLADREANNQLANSQSQIAMRGGLSSGASERMASNINRDNMLNKQNIGYQDDQQKIDLLGQVANAESARDQYNAGAFTNAQNRRMDALNRVGTVEQDINRSNIGTLRSDINSENQLKQGYYNADAQALAASRQADAQRAAGSSGGGGCFITTAVCERMGFDDDNQFLNTFRKFRDEHMGGKEAVADYYKIAPIIVERIKEYEEEEILDTVLAKFLIPAYQLIKTGENEKAEKLYSAMVLLMAEMYELNTEIK